MVSLRIFMNAEQMGLGTDPKDVIIADKNMSIGVLPSGMTSGKPSVSMIFDLPSGEKVFAETSLRLFLTAARAFASVYGWPEDME